LRFIHREIEQLRDENHNQNREIGMLKEMMVINQNINKTSSNQEAKLIEESSTGHRPSSELPRRIKRPVRILPPYLFRNEAIRQFYGPPTNCSDLSQLGYTLNGFYLVQSNTTNPNDTDSLKTETVYCAFKQPNGPFNPNSVEKRVSAITSSKFDDAPSNSLNRSSINSGVHFHVQTTSVRKTVASKTIVQFKNVILNMGDGFDSETGIFTVPKSGIYQLTFSGSMYLNAARRESPSNIILSVNSSSKQRHSLQITDNLQLNRFLQAIIQLNRGDEISIQIRTNTGPVDHLDISTFSGSLLEEIVD